MSVSKIKKTAARPQIKKPDYLNTAAIGLLSVVQEPDPSSTLNNALPPKPAVKFLDAKENHESITIVVFDPQSHMANNFYSSLRFINHYAESYTDAETCFVSLESLDERVFFICVSTNMDIITRANAMQCIEGIFVLKLDEPLAKNDFPKYMGVFEEQEELMRKLREAIEVLQYIKFEEILFESDNGLLWMQLWKDQILLRKPPYAKPEFIEVVQNYYASNPNVLALIEVFEHSYILADALSWCLRSPFPVRFLSHALYSRDLDQLDSCRFLIADASRFIKRQNKHTSSVQLYRGMKLPPALVEKLSKNTGKLMCTSWFLTCTKSRTAALSAAASSAFRSDLIPVLFKIDCDTTTAYFELTKNTQSPTFVLDLGTTFRILFVGKDQMVVVKMKVAPEDGQKLIREYRKKFDTLSNEELLIQLTDPRKLRRRLQQEGQLLSSPESNKRKTKHRKKKRSGHSDSEINDAMGHVMSEEQRNRIMWSSEDMHSVRSTRSKLERWHAVRWRDLARR